MKFPNLTPITHIKKAFLEASDFVEDMSTDNPHQAAMRAMQRDRERDDSSLEPATKAVVSVEQNTGRDAVPVAEPGIWISANALDSGDASQRTKEFETIVNSFDEDKETVGHWITHKIISILCYTLPALFAIFGGWAIGDAFCNAQTPVATSIFYHMMSVGVELLTPIAGIMCAKKVQQAKKDRSLIVLCVILAIVFLFVAVANAFAQEVFLYALLPQKSNIEIASVWFRAFGPSIFDAIALSYLAVASAKSLKKFLADQTVKAAAVGQVAASAINLDRAHLQAGIERQQALQDMQSKSRRATTWNEIEAMQAEQMIETAKRNMIGDGNTSRRSRYQG